MNLVKEPVAGRFVMMAAWECAACDVQGRTEADAELSCWNCEGQVVVVARPTVRLKDI